MNVETNTGTPEGAEAWQASQEKTPKKTEVIEIPENEAKTFWSKVAEAKYGDDTSSFLDNRDIERIEIMDIAEQIAYSVKDLREVAYKIINEALEEKATIDQKKESDPDSFRVERHEPMKKSSVAAVYELQASQAERILSYLSEEIAQDKKEGRDPTANERRFKKKVREAVVAGKFAKMKLSIFPLIGKDSGDMLARAPLASPMYIARGGFPKIHGF